MTISEKKGDLKVKEEVMKMIGLLVQRAEKASGANTPDEMVMCANAIAVLVAAVNR